METTDITKDPNHIAYLELLKGGKLRPYEGTYIAIVDGELVDNDLSRDALLGRVRGQFQTQPKYVTKVLRQGEEEPIYDIPCVFSIEDRV